MMSEERTENTTLWVWGILIYTMIWGIALGLSITFDLNPFPTKTSFLWNIIVWGAVGGTLRSFYRIIKHGFWKKDFDKAYAMWHVVQPVIGYLMGSLVYILVTVTGILQHMDTHWEYLFWVLAAITGFNHLSVLRAIDWFVGLFILKRTANTEDSE